MPDPVFLSGDRVELRPIEEADLEFLQRHVNDPRVWRAIGRSKPLNRVQERAFFDDVVCSDESIQLLLVAESTPVGTIGLQSIDWVSSRAELGYWIAPDHQRNGYASDAVERIVTYGFDQLGLHRIAARVFACNEPSRRLLESVGFRQEGVHRDVEFIDGEHQNAYWYGLLEDEWRSETA